MSIYSDWKAGLLTDDEYAALFKREYLEDLDRERRGEFDDWDESEDFEDDDIDEF